MRKFLVLLTLLSGVILFYNVPSSLKGLSRLKSHYPFPRSGAIKLIDPKNHTQKNLLVIGCSNLQFNIDCKAVQEGINTDVDFLYFAASENSTFLQYVVDIGMTKGYKKVILYMPYQLLKKKRFLMNSTLSYKVYSSYGYASTTIKNYPPNLLYNWSAYYDSIAKYSGPSKRIASVLKKDVLMDSLRDNETSYSNCNFAFDHFKHIVDIPTYTEDDVKFINHLKEKDQEVFLLFTPLPNRRENKASLEKTNVIKVGFPNVLNLPCMLDSSLFYDQWYHLNQCGSRIETEKMVQILKSMLSGS